MKILLLDDHALFRAGLKLLLKTLEPGAVVHEAGSKEEALQETRHNPDINLCLLDIRLRHENGLDLVNQLKGHCAEMAVVVVSAAEDTRIVRESIEAGAMSFINKSVTPDVLSTALRFVLAGEVYVPPIVMEADEASDVSRISLTPRQWDVLRCLCRGMPTKSIANNLGVSEYTIKDHIGSIFQVLEVRNRTEAVIKASRLRLLSEHRPA